MYLVSTKANNLHFFAVITGTKRPKTSETNSDLFKDITDTKSQSTVNKKI
jgi:hypothetical protein